MTNYLPKICDICKDKIGLYQPFYTIQSESRFIWKGNEKERVILCPACFHAYKDFLTSREEYFIYKNAKQI